MSNVFWFYHCGSCGVVSTKLNKICPVCESADNIRYEQVAIAVKGSENFPLPIGVGISADQKH